MDMIIAWIVSGETYGNLKKRELFCFFGIYFSYII
jgi:hypothetical protein